MTQPTIEANSYFQNVFTYSLLLKQLTIISEDADYIFDGITGTLPIIGGVPTLN